MEDVVGVDVDDCAGRGVGFYEGFLLVGSVKWRNCEVRVGWIGSSIVRINAIKRISTHLINAFSPTDPAMTPKANDIKVAPRTAVRIGVGIVVDNRQALVQRWTGSSQSLKRVRGRKKDRGQEG